MLKIDISYPNKYLHLVIVCPNKLSLFDVTKIEHLYREQNEVASHLAVKANFVNFIYDFNDLIMFLPPGMLSCFGRWTYVFNISSLSIGAILQCNLFYYESTIVTIV